MFRFLVASFLLSTLAFADVGIGTAQAEKVRIKHDGLTLNGELNIVEGKILKDGVVLVVHGTLAHSGMGTIKNLTDVLAERELNTLAITLSLGVDDRHGMYDCKVAHRHRHLDALKEIEAWMAWLQSRGVGDVVLFGHSRGGNQVARYAAEQGHVLLKRLVLLAPANWDETRAAKGFERNHGQPLSSALEKARALLKAGRSSEIMKGMGLLFCRGADVSAESFVSYYQPDLRFDTPSILNEIKVPTLVIAGGKDIVVRGLAEQVEGLADGSRLQLTVIDDAGHFFLDLLAEDVADAMEAFLSPGG